jgi:hypothetical protein
VLAAPKVRLSVPVESSVAVCVVVVPETIELPERRPTEFVVNVMVPAVAFADGAATTDTRPAVNAVTATSAMRLRSVFVDMFFLSLVRFRNFLDLARRSCEIL